MRWLMSARMRYLEIRRSFLHMQPISYLSDANKIAWVRAFLGWAYSRVSVKGAKPLSEVGQGIPVYAGGQEIRTGREGLMTSDWG